MAGIYIPNLPSHNRAVLLLLSVVLLQKARKYKRLVLTFKLPCNQRIACAGRDSEIILQYVPLPVLRLNKVYSRNMAVNALWRSYSGTGRKIAFRDINEILGNYALLYDFTLGIYVL